MLSRLSIRAKLYAGFGSTLALTAILAGYGFYGAASSSEDFSHYRSTAGQSVAYSEISKFVLQARLAVMKFRVQGGNQEGLASVQDNMVQLKEAKKRLAGLDVSTEERAKLDGIAQGADEYVRSFEKAAALQTKRHQLVDEKFAPAGTEARKNLSEIMESAHRDNDTQAAYYAGRAQQHLLLARLYGQQFLLTNKKDDQVRTESEIQAALKEINTLLSALQNPRRRDLTQSAQQNLEIFSSTFKQLVDAINERNAIYNTQLDVLGPKIIDSATSIMKAEVAEQDRLGPVIAGEFIQQEVIAVAVGSVVVLLGAFIAVMLSKALANPIVAMTSAMRNLAANDFNVIIPSLDREDEIGAMAKAVDVFKQNGIERERLEAAAEARRQKELESQEHLSKSLEIFKGTITKNLDILLNEVGGLRGTSQTLLSVADQGSTEANSSANSCSEAASSAQAVAAATEELNASIREIATQANHTSTIVGETTEKAQMTDQEVAKLTEAVNKIESVITLIRSIAQQTNLLALNATIESARAGEAGRGFAVVAAEVKALSEQTARATEDIAEQIQAVQMTTGTAADAIRVIGSQVGEIHTLASSVAAAVEEQQAATADIARNVHIAATGSQQASESARIVTQVAEQTGTEAKRVSSASDQLQSVSSAVSKAIQDFIDAVSSDLDERRNTPRTTVNKAIVITKSGEFHEAKASDVSKMGMKISGVKGIKAGDNVQVDFGSGQVNAKVAWANVGTCGLQFETLLNSRQLDASTWKDVGERKRAA